MSQSGESSAPFVSEFAGWVTLGAAVGAVCGVASALFLWGLEEVTELRTEHRSLVFALPLAGVLIGLFYERFGRPIEAGSNLIIDTIHDDGPEIPLRMAPMVLAGTLLTHLFGGSAGREGTAVQMGASLADTLAHRLRLPLGLRRKLLTAGVAGGFGSVFGTPVAGMIFGLEFVVLGRLEYGALVPALVASLVGDYTTRALGIEHTPYPQVAALPLSPSVLLKWFAFALCCALLAAAFIELTHALKRQATRFIPRLPWRMALGGTVVVLMWLATSDDYLGLGVPTILRAFSDPSLPAAEAPLKLVFTAVTLGAGFLGGEVTPLFFVGATLGNLLGRVLGLPLELAAGVGLSAVFAGAAKAPLALSVMALELLGANVFPHAVLVCVLTYFFSGRRSIYAAKLKPGRVT
ncbi:MAG: chloride channel protein [Myxococcales bacterium]